MSNLLSAALAGLFFPLQLCLGGDSSIRAYVRDPGTPKRGGRQTRQQYARALRRGIHPANLHPRHTADTAKGRGENGQLHGTDPIGPTGKQSTGKETVSSPVLFGSFRAFRCTHGA